MVNYKKSIVSIVLTIFVISMLFLSGPVSALTVAVTQPNNANKGNDVSFSITNEINDPDLLPIQYTDLVITGPNGFSKTCRINPDGTDDCADVDITVSSSPTITYVSGTQYGYDQNLGLGYNLGNGFGYQSGGTGTITYDIVWHTSSTLDDGTYNANAAVFSQGSSSSHTFNSPLKSFTITTASQGGNSGGGGGGGHNFVNENTTTPTVITTPAENPITPNPTEEVAPNPTEEVVPIASSSPTGFAIVGDLVKKNPIISIISALAVLSLLGYGFYWLRKK